MAPAKPKTTASSGRPSMNQLAQSSVSATSSTTTNFSSGLTSFSGGPNYNINTSPMPQSRAPMSGIGMGIQPGRMGMHPGMGAPMQSGMGIGQPGIGMMGQQQQPGMGMGQPGMRMGQPGGGMNYGNMGYMQQQSTMGGFGTTQMNMGMQYQRPF